MAKQFRNRGSSNQAGPKAAEIPLPEPLSQFRQALQLEMEAAQRVSSASAVPLKDGRLIGRIAEECQYQFDIESALDLPGDTPGDLSVPGREPIPVVIVSVDGLSITLSVKAELGAFVPSARLQSNLSMLLRKLIERIESRASSPNTEANRVLGSTPATGTPEQLSNADLSLLDAPLNPEQLRAVASVLGRNVTFIWGPPGTGKTYTIGALGGELARRGRSLLLVSHTNTAVDTALLKIAEALDRNGSQGLITEGRVIRIGNPKNVQLAERKDLLLRTHVERKSGELIAKRDELQREQETLRTEMDRLSRLQQLHEWRTCGAADIDRMEQQASALADATAEGELLRERAQQVFASLASKGRLERLATNALNATHLLASIAAKQQELTVEATRLESELGAARAQLSHEVSVLSLATSIQPLRDEAQTLPSLEECHRQRVSTQSQVLAANARMQDLKVQLAEADQMLAETSQLGWLARKWRGLPDPDAQSEQCVRVKALLSGAQEALGVTTEAHSSAIAQFDRVQSLTSQLHHHSAIPNATLQNKLTDSAQRRVQGAERELSRAVGSNRRLAIEAEEAAATVKLFTGESPEQPESFLQAIQSQRRELEQLSAQMKVANDEELARRFALEREVVPKLAAVRHFGLTECTSDNVSEVIVALREALDAASRELEGVQLDDVQRQLDECRNRLGSIAVALSAIEESLKRVEELIIKDALVVATTLTRAYLRDSIQQRRFDTGVLDEASMAPIPALWVAASLCERSVALVGDFKQLPPVVISTDPVAQEWLGRDVFAVAGLTDPEGAPDHFVGLKVQRRMRPEISVIANKLIYGGQLRDDPVTGVELRHDWFNKDWGFD